MLGTNLSTKILSLHVVNRYFIWFLPQLFVHYKDRENEYGGQYPNEHRSLNYKLYLLDYSYINFCMQIISDWVSRLAVILCLVLITSKNTRRCRISFYPHPHTQPLCISRNTADFVINVFPFYDSTKSAIKITKSQSK